MIVSGLNTDKIAEAITRDLPFGLWCANFKTKTITGYNKFGELLNTSVTQLAFDDLASLIREDYRNIAMLNYGDIQSNAEFELTFPTNQRWLHVKLTHYDRESEKAYGYVVECFHDNERFQDKNEAFAIVNKQVNLLNKVFNTIESDRSKKAISKVISDILATSGADRISVVEYNFMTRTQTCVYDAANYGVASRLDVITDISLETTPWINTRIGQRKPIYIYDIDALPSDQRIQLTVLCCNDVKTILFLPLCFKEEVYGYVIIDFMKKRELTTIEIDSLKAVCRFVEFISHTAKDEKKAVGAENTYQTMIDNMPFGYLNLRYRYDTNGEPDGIVILRTNKHFEEMVGKTDICGRTIEQIFDRESEHILNVCNEVARTNEKRIVDDFMFVNGQNLSADVMMPNYNEFVCIISPNSETIYSANKPNSHNQPVVDASIDNESFAKEVQQLQRTHLNAILGFAELLCMESDEKQKENYMSIIKENAQSLLDASVIRNALSQEEAAEQTKEAPSQSQGENRRKKILVAEDNESNYMLVEFILKKDYDLVWARDGIEAIEKHTSEKPDLILMDVRMPRLSGITATSRIREKDRDTPIIALTAFAFESDKQKTLEAGCNDFMAKPINAHALREIVKKYI